MNSRSPEKLMLMMALATSLASLYIGVSISPSSFSSTNHYDTLTKNTQRALLDRMLICDVLKEQSVSLPPRTVNFLASAVGSKYEDILPLYVFFSLKAHHVGHTSVAEIIVSNQTSFLNKHAAPLSWLNNKFSLHERNFSADALCVRQFSADHSIRTSTTNTWRFLEVPVRLSAQFTYIGDVDIFLTESVLDPMRFRQMDEYHLPYSDIVRDYSAMERRLTGLILLDTKAFYVPSLLRAQMTVQARGNDEVFLYNIIVEAGLGVPPSNSTSPLLMYRPQHGTHLSLNRGPGKRLCTASPEAFRRLMDVPDLNEYRRIDTFADRFLAEQQIAVEEQHHEGMVVRNKLCQRKI